VDGKVMAEKTLEEKIWDELRLCFDYEIPVNIVDLGLVYSVRLNDLDGGGKEAVIEMTFTSAMCPMADTIKRDVERRVGSVEDIKKVTLQIVWDPPWDVSRMSEAAKLQLGML
jgi:metal-sulfur cluster biosynthetic enzyme